jgi:hydrogenase-4 component F
MIELLAVTPAVCGLAVFFIPARAGKIVLVAVGMAHLPLSLAAWLVPLAPMFPKYFAMSPEGTIALLSMSFLFATASVHSLGYLGKAAHHGEKAFIGAMLFLLAAMSMAVISDHVVVMWIAIEATTLAGPTLIYLHGTREALEAAWKYALICSVGVALALLGTFLLMLAPVEGSRPVFTFSAMLAAPPEFNLFWLKTAFVFMLVGYGAKSGIAPMHTWLPDAHSQAPGPVSALLSGALLNCAFLGVYRMSVVLRGVGEGDFVGGALCALGLLSMLVAATFAMRQPEHKRLLAYSSVEHMGIMAFGVGIGGLGTFGAFLHMIHHSLLKGAFFFAAGSAVKVYGTKLVERTGEMARLAPGTFAAFFASFIGVSGLPPFGLFISKFLIVVAAFSAGKSWMAAWLLIMVGLVFAGMARSVMRMSFRHEAGTPPARETALLAIPPFAPLIASLALTWWPPRPLLDLVAAAARFAGVSIL